MSESATAVEQGVAVGGGGRRGVFRGAVEARLRGLEGGQVTLIDAGRREVFGDAGAGLRGTIEVLDPRFYRKTVLGGALGFAEAYMEGMWTTPDLTALLRVFVRNISTAHELEKTSAKMVEPLRRMAHAVRRNSRLGSRRNIAAHYDLGNEFFALFLDETMTYSCGIFESADSTMREASVEKLDRICRKLELGAGDHVLEIGTGWGSFAMHAAGAYGCRVTTTTISKEQHALASDRIEAAGFGDRVEVLLRDYRDIEGRYDKLVSIEMIEAVGHKYLDTYFRTCARLLNPDGRMCIQAIVMPDRRYRAYLRTADFIQRYVFPGSNCPSPGAIAASVARASDLRMVDMEDITAHYATTLARWRDAFEARIEDVRALGYPERFVRMWRYYLSYCEAGFAERYIGTGQLVFDKPRRGVQA